MLSLATLLDRTRYRLHDRSFRIDALLAALVAGITGGIPSTLLALLTDDDVLRATRAAGAMLIDAHASIHELVIAAALVHGAISLFWASVLILTLPVQRTIAWATAASAAIAVLDLRIIAPFAFHEVAALPFWPQFADHLAWGASAGVVMTLRWRTRRVGIARQ